MSAQASSIPWPDLMENHRYKVPFHVYGIDSKWLVRAGTLAAGFGASAGIFLVFFFDGIPRVQRGMNIPKLKCCLKVLQSHRYPRQDPFHQPVLQQADRPRGQPILSAIRGLSGTEAETVNKSKAIVL